MDYREYWVKRAENNIKRGESISNSTLKALKKPYVETANNINKAVVGFLAKYSNEGLMPITDLRKTLTKEELKEYKLLLSKYINYLKEIKSVDISEEMQKAKKLSTMKKVSRQNILELYILLYLTELGLKKEEKLHDSIKTSYEESYYHSIYDIQRYDKEGTKVKALDEEETENIITKPWLDENYSERIYKERDKTNTIILRSILQCMALQQDYNTMTGLINKNMDSSYTRTKGLVKTEVSHAVDEAVEITYKEMGISKYQFVVILDNRTSEICREMDLQVFDIKDAQVGINYPPMHPNCRSSTIPYDNPEEVNKGTRMARTVRGKLYEVPATLSYNEWKKVRVY